MLQNIATEEFGHLEMVALMIEQHTKRAKQGAQEKAFNSTLFAVRGYGPHLVDFAGFDLGFALCERRRQRGA